MTHEKALEYADADEPWSCATCETIGIIDLTQFDDLEDANRWPPPGLPKHEIVDVWADSEDAVWPLCRRLMTTLTLMC